MAAPRRAIRNTTRFRGQPFFFFFFFGRAQNASGLRRDLDEPLGVIDHAGRSAAATPSRVRMAKPTSNWSGVGPELVRTPRRARVVEALKFMHRAGRPAVVVLRRRVPYRSGHR